MVERESEMMLLQPLQQLSSRSSDCISSMVFVSMATRCLITTGAEQDRCWDAGPVRAGENAGDDAESGSGWVLVEGGGCEVDV